MPIRGGATITEVLHPSRVHWHSLREMTRKYEKKEIRKRLENNRLEYKEKGEDTGLVERVPVRKKSRKIQQAIKDLRKGQS